MMAPKVGQVRNWIWAVEASGREGSDE